MSITLPSGSETLKDRVGGFFPINQIPLFDIITQQIGTTIEEFFVDIRQVFHNDPNVHKFGEFLQRLAFLAIVLKDCHVEGPIGEIDTAGAIWTPISDKI